MDRLRALVSTVVVVLAVAACGNGAASVSFGEPADGATVSSPVQVVMGADGITIEPAGEVRKGAGHFHIMIDVGCVAQGDEIPADDQHVHFGDASTEASLELTPGEHTLCLQAGDGLHTALSATNEITITVE